VLFLKLWDCFINRTNTTHSIIEIKLHHFLKFFLSIFVFLYSELIKVRKLYLYIFKFFLNEIDILKFVKSDFKVNKYSFKNKHFSKFLELNKYNSNKKNNSKVKRKKIIAESIINHPLYTLGSCIIASTLSNNKNYDIVGLIRKGDIFGAQIMKSFGIDEIKIIDNSNIISRLIYFYKSFFILSKTKNIKEILKFKIRDIEIGKAVYEHYLRFVGKPPTKINWKIIIFFAESLYYIDRSKKLLKNLKPKYWIQSEKQFIPHRILSQQVLKFKTKIIARNNINQVSIKMYKSFKERNMNRNKITYKLFNKLNKKYKKIILKKTNKLFFINNKNNKVGSEVHQIIDNKKIYNEFKSKETFNSYFKFKNSNPVVLILAHQMTDGAFSNSWNLFRDDIDWLKQTLKIAKEIKNINFIIKSHPSEKFYNSKITTKKIFKELISDKVSNIKLFPNNYDINSLINYINVLITSHGSAGYEYPAKSIPTIICGETFYSGLGFNIEPKSIKEYKKIVNNIPQIKKLNKFQTDKAKIFWYIYLVVTRVKMPLIHFSNIRMDYNKDQFWKNTILKLSNLTNDQNKFEKCLMHQIQNNNSNLINYKTLDVKNKN